MSLRESTAELHSKAEKMPFNQKMFKGELSKTEYLHYLYQQAAIFTIIEQHKLPHPDLAREGKIFLDGIDQKKTNTIQFIMLICRLLGCKTQVCTSS